MLSLLTFHYSARQADRISIFHVLHRHWFLFHFGLYSIIVLSHSAWVSLLSAQLPPARYCRKHLQASS